MPEGQGYKPSRRSFLTATGAATTVAMAGCIGGGGSDDDGPISFLLNPAEANVEITLQYKPIATYLEDELDIEVELTQTNDYSATFTELESGRGDLADTSPSAIVATESFADVLGIRKAFGAEKYFSLITTPVSTDIQEISDLQGEQVALGSPLSVSSGIVPTLMLKEGGLEIGDLPIDPSAGNFEAQYAGGHFQAYDAAVSDSSVKACCTGAFITASNVPQEQFDEMSQDFVDLSAEYEGAGEDAGDQEMRLLAVSDPIPRAPIMVRSDWDHPKRDEIEETMLNLPDEAYQHDPEQLISDLNLDISPEDLEKPEEELSDSAQEDVAEYENHELWFDDISEASNEDYQFIKEVLDELGLEFQDITGGN